MEGTVSTFGGSITIKIGAETHTFPITMTLLSLVGKEVRIKCIGEPAFGVLVYDTLEEAESAHAGVLKLIRDYYRLH